VVERGVNNVGTCVRALIPAVAPGGNEVAVTPYAPPALTQSAGPDYQDSLPHRAANPG